MIFQSHSMIFRSLSFLAVATIGLSAAEVDLVKLGKETFNAVGCAECHSEIKGDAAIKAGPGVYRVFPTSAGKRYSSYAG